MEINGNLKLLKSEIKKEYLSQFEDFRNSELKSFEDEKQRIQEDQNKAIKKIKEDLKKEEESIFKVTLSDKKLEAKKSFEQKREDLINQIFIQALDECKEVLTGRQYVSMVKDAIKGKKDVELIGGFEEYKKSFPEITINPAIDGIRVFSEKSVTDFTYSSFIENKKSELRQKISEILFEGMNDAG